MQYQKIIVQIKSLLLSNYQNNKSNSITHSIMYYWRDNNCSLIVMNEKCVLLSSNSFKFDSICLKKSTIKISINENK